MSNDRSGGAGPYPRPVTPITPSSPPPADRRPALVDRPDPADLYAALDLGTNSCRMLIAQPKGNQLHVVDSFSKSVQLGQGLEASGRLGRASMARAVGALKICQKKLESTGWSGCAWSRRRPAAAPPMPRSSSAW
jgi:exopolyphosphatase/guanosine-5'-triphosphate,3'-diphosphate pyrophosphatase